MQEFKEQQKVMQSIAHLFNTFEKSNCVIRPHFFLTGASGSGKSFMISQMAEKAEMGFIELNAAQLTVEGVSGNSLSKALAPLKNFTGQPTVVFVDEFDKLLYSDGTEASSSRTGVQDELLKCLESDNISVFGDYGKYIQVQADNLLFVFAGAFNSEQIDSLEKLKEKGLRNEFLGRVSLILHAQTISLDSLLEAVPESNLLASYMKLYKSNKTKTIESIKERVTVMYKKHNLGVRLITSAIHQHYLENQK